MSIGNSINRLWYETSMVKSVILWNPMFGWRIYVKYYADETFALFTQLRNTYALWVAQPRHQGFFACIMSDTDGLGCLYNNLNYNHNLVSPIVASPYFCHNIWISCVRYESFWSMQAMIANQDSCSRWILGHIPWHHTMGRQLKNRSLSKW